MSRRLTRDDWVAKGLARLAEDGPEALKLAAICASAGVTRGSFYHHFEDHGAFLVALTEGWIDRQTKAVIDAVPADLSPADAALALTELAIGIDFRLELGIRELARRHPPVAERVAVADASRLAVLGRLYERRYGVDAVTARFAAMVEYATFVGTMLITPGMSDTAQREMARKVDALFEAAFSKPE